MTSPRPPLVAVVNKIPTLSTYCRRGLETHGIRAVCGGLRDFRRGHDDVVEFIKRHNPIGSCATSARPTQPIGITWSSCA